MLAALLSFCTSASFYTALAMAAIWLGKELTMGIYRGKERLDGKLVVITGANCGIGLEVRKSNLSQLASRQSGSSRQYLFCVTMLKFLGKYSIHR